MGAVNCSVTLKIQQPKQIIFICCRCCLLGGNMYFDVLLIKVSIKLVSILQRYNSVSSGYQPVNFRKYQQPGCSVLPVFLLSQAQKELRCDGLSFNSNLPATLNYILYGRVQRTYKHCRSHHWQFQNPAKVSFYSVSTYIL